MQFTTVKMCLSRSLTNRYKRRLAVFDADDEGPPIYAGKLLLQRVSIVEMRNSSGNIGFGTNG